MAGRAPVLNHARVKKNTFETWSLAEAIGSHALMAGHRRRLLNPQRLMINKWSKRLVKKKRGSIHFGSQLFETVTSKPLGVRMGNGRGRPSGRSAWLVAGSRLLTLNQVYQHSALRLSKLVKKSNLNLKIVKLYY